jgi:hypothetical protein
VAKRSLRVSLAPMASAGFAFRRIFVMPGLVPGIHVFAELKRAETWMAGTSPAMTENELSNAFRSGFQEIAAR